MYVDMYGENRTLTGCISEWGVCAAYICVSEGKVFLNVLTCACMLHCTNNSYMYMYIILILI